MAESSNRRHNGTTRCQRAAITANLTGLVFAGSLGAGVTASDARAAPTNEFASVTSIVFGDWPTGPPDHPVPPSPPGPPGAVSPAPPPEPPNATEPPGGPSTFGPNSRPGTLGWLLFWTAATA